MNCLKCGNKITKNMKFCEKCGKPVDLGEIRSKAKKGFDLSEKEVEVRTYHCTTLENPNAEGYVTVTNKRVIYHGHGDSSYMHSEVHMNKITGMRSYFGSGHNMKKIIFAIIFTLLSILVFLLAGGETWANNVGVITFIIAIILFITSKEVSYCFAISAEGGNGSAVQIGYMANAGDLTGQGAGMSINAMPTDETKRMMSELGAIILDFQNLGDHALKKWVQEIEEGKSVDIKKPEIQKTDNGEVSNEAFFS